MHQIRFRLGILLQTPLGELIQSYLGPSWTSGSLVLREVTGMEGRGRKGRKAQKGREGKRVEGREGGKMEEKRREWEGNVQF